MKTTNQLVLERIKKLAKANHDEGIVDFDIDKYEWLLFGLDTKNKPCTYTSNGIKMMYEIAFNKLGAINEKTQ